MVIVYIILAWLLYQLVVKFIIPTYITARQIKRQIKDIQQRMGSFSDNKERVPPTHASPAPGDEKKEKSGEYIEFEEVKQP